MQPILGDCFKIACVTTSELASVPGRAIGYLVGRNVGALAGAVVVGGAKLSNTLFNTNYKPKSINQYSLSTATTAQALGGLVSSKIIPATTAPILGVPIILGKVFALEYNLKH
ncbi:hypothetical protein [Endozoicomonas sp. 4G]|uniref:hypothetical protein n=1 Tax=Endozoicomonas sp. 4G TaxID=2872754 RepID=UPI002078DEFA|nr:hypothetical protein [Endozoicomonas sp. 4G]